MFNYSNKKLSTPITLLPGSGINPVTIQGVISTLLPMGMKELHLTGGEWVEGGMLYRPGDMGMGVIDHEWAIWKTSEDSIKQVREISDNIIEDSRMASDRSWK